MKICRWTYILQTEKILFYFEIVSNYITDVGFKLGASHSIPEQL